jgi:hypothetical protein
VYSVVVDGRVTFSSVNGAKVTKLVGEAAQRYGHHRVRFHAQKPPRA